MKNIFIFFMLLIVGGSGYWAGHHFSNLAVSSTTPVIPPDPGKSSGGGRQLLYYRNPMGLADTSPTPKKDSMGMDYIPVYSGEETDTVLPGQVRISNDKIQKLGVRTIPAQISVLNHSLQLAGRVEADERRLYGITAKWDGYVEQLHINTTGQWVNRGQPLFEVYSPELFSAQREYATAAAGIAALQGTPALAGMEQLANASLARLKNWDISPEQLKTLTHTGIPQRTLTFRSPASGVVLEKKIIQGMKFSAGELLYQLADLTAVWVMADVYEQDIPWVKIGNKVTITLTAYPDQVFTGTVSYLYPTLNTTTRTVPFRVELANPQGLLKPGLLAQLALMSTTSTPVLTVPLSAVIDSGTRQVVLVEIGEGRYVPQLVRLGSRNEQEVEIRDGITAGQRVVVAANFLIDAESNLQAALAGFGTPEGKGTAKTTVSHQATGKLDAIVGATVTISHNPVASLNWPAMTMEFQLAHDGLLGNIKPGTSVAFEFVERAPGEWVITAVRPN